MRLIDAAAKVVTVPMVVAVDVETSGLHWWRDTLGVVSFSWGDEPDESYATRNIPVAISMVQERMNNGLPVVFHNASFDLHFLKKAGLRPVWATVHDTLLMSRLKNNLGQSDLKSMGKRT
jgi:ribonuclease D